MGFQIFTFETNKFVVGVMSKLSQHKAQGRRQNESNGGAFGFHGGADPRPTLQTHYPHSTFCRGEA